MAERKRSITAGWPGIAGLASGTAGEAAPGTATRLEGASFALLLATLAWAPFPLGSNRPWSWSLLCILVGACWILWLASVWMRQSEVVELAKGLAWPGALAALALLWGIIQIEPWVPRGWPHPVWQMADDVLGTHAAGVISLNPWRTETELMKLLAYGMAAWLARAFARRPERARLLLHVLIGIGAFYGAYALVLASLGLQQFNVFYAGPPPTHDIAGPFVLHNGYATFAGLLTLCAGVRLVEAGWESVVATQGLRRFLLTLVQYLSGRGVVYVLAGALSLSTLVASGSRAGNFSAVVAMSGLLVLSFVVGARHTRMRWVAGIAAAVIVAVWALFLVNGSLLAARLNDLLQLGYGPDLRLMLWNAAMRMIHDAPLLGFGLGTFENAYPMYADAMFRLVMDKTHNDYLELAAGWGLPAAVLWWTALAWLAVKCVRGVFERHRHRVYAMLAAGACVLVGVHSAFDFSLQMPAVALTFATILGMGVAQSFRSRHRGDTAPASAHAAPLSPVQSWLVRAALVLPALAISVTGLPRLVSGFAQEAAFPVPVYMAMNVVLPQKAYSSAAQVLSHAGSANGGLQVARGEALLHAGGRPQDAIAALKSGLSHAPAEARGWIVLAEALGPQDPRKAAAALSLALELAPREYYLVSPRLIAGAPLWAYLPDEDRSVLLNDTRQVFEDFRLAQTRETLLRTPGGPALVTRAFAGQNEQLRALNRMRARKRLGL